MSEIREMILDTVNRFIADGMKQNVLAEYAAEQFPDALWQQVEEAGLPMAALSEEAGGVGLALDDALAMLRPLAMASVPLPVGETILARWLAERAGLHLGEGPHSFVPGYARDRLEVSRAASGWQIDGTVTRVPWARHGASLLIRFDHDGQSFAARLLPMHYRIMPGASLAGEPRDDVAIAAQLTDEDVGPLADFAADQWMALGAAMRSVQMAGAMQQATDLTVSYVADRAQFGRKLQQFQSVQQNLALLAGQVASANAAAEIAMEAASRGVRTSAIASAKIRCGEAAKMVSQIAHQLHGAIGFTEEYSLHHSTRRLWSWRDEFGDEGYWAQMIGNEVCGAGGSAVWPWITGVTSYESADAC